MGSLLLFYFYYPDAISCYLSLAQKGFPDVWGTQERENVAGYSKSYALLHVPLRSRCGPTSLALVQTRIQSGPRGVSGPPVITPTIVANQTYPYNTLHPHRAFYCLICVRCWLLAILGTISATVLLGQRTGKWTSIAPLDH